MSSFGVCEVDEDFHILFPSRFPPVKLYTRLGGAAIQQAAEALEAKTNPRLREQERLARGGPPAGAHELQNWNHAPFAYPSPEPSTFLGPGHRVLELVKGVPPALALAVRRREAFLSGTAEPAIRIEMRLVVRRVTGRFADLTGAPLEPDAEARRSLGAQIYGSDASGILFNRPDLGGCRSVAIFDGGVLGRARQSDHFRFEWDGEAVTTVGNLSSHAVIERDALFANLADRAAA